MRTRRLLLTSLVAALGAIGLVIGADADDHDGYEQGNYGRIRTLDPSATLIRATATDHEADSPTAELNSPIFPGDTLLTASRERAEVQLAGGALVRLDKDTSVGFLSLPDPYADVADNAVLKLNAGTIRVIGRGETDSEFRVDTPAASVYLLGEAELRIQVLEDGVTRVTSTRGVAEVVGEGGSVLVRGGTRSRIEPRSLPDAPQSFNTFAGDPFDAWCATLDDDARDRLRQADAGIDAYDQVPQEVRPYYPELASYGRWVYVPSYGYGWVPRVATGFRPYVNGYWTYGPGGYFWTSYDPWGWAPYHYGRWTWATEFGWCWLPGRVFAGAWVSWSWGPSYVGWCPLDYWDRPCYHGTRVHGSYDPHSWTFVATAHLGYRGGYGRHAVPIDQVGASVTRNAIVTRPPRVSPAEFARSASTRDRALREVTERRQPGTVPGSRAAVSTRSFDRTESELRGRIAADANGLRRAATSTEVPSSFPKTRAPRAPRRSEPLSPRAGSDVLRTPRNARPQPPGAFEPRIDRENRGPVRLDRDRRYAAPRRDQSGPVPDSTQGTRDRKSFPIDRRPTQPGGSIRELYRRVAAPRVIDPPEGHERAQRQDPPAPQAAPAPRPSRSGERAAPTRPPSAPRERAAGAQSHGGERGHAKRR